MDVFLANAQETAPVHFQQITYKTHISMHVIDTLNYAACDMEAKTRHHGSTFPARNHNRFASCMI